MALSGGPDGTIVGEVDDTGIELLEGIDPVRDGGQGLAVTVAMSAPGELVSGVLCRRVVALARQDHCSIGAADDQRLVTVGVTRCGHEEHPGQYLNLVSYWFEAGALDEFGERVAGRAAGGSSGLPPQ